MSINDSISGANRANGLDLNHYAEQKKPIIPEILESNGKSILIVNQHEGDVIIINFTPLGILHLVESL